jgi:hypothetical protein
MAALQNNHAQHQNKKDEPMYFVSHFTLPFKCIKKIEAQHVNAMFDAADGSFLMSFMLWQLDQSGRDSVTVKKARTVNMPKK